MWLHFRTEASACLYPIRQGCFAEWVHPLHQPPLTRFATDYSILYNETSFVDRFEVAERNSMLLNLIGAHTPYFIRNLEHVISESGHAAWLAPGCDKRSDRQECRHTFRLLSSVTVIQGLLLTVFDLFLAQHAEIPIEQS